MGKPYSISHLDDSVYQDFSVIQVETNRYNYELNLHTVPEDNPLYENLKICMG